MPKKWDAAYTDYKKKIHTFARNSFFSVPGFAVEDMEQELLEVLWWCTFDYHPRNGATFNTYFQTAAHNRISTLIRASTTMKRSADVTSLDIDEVRAAIEEIFLDESAESTALRKISIREYVVAEGEPALRMLLKTQGIGALEQDECA